jgi:hypothetical protein
MKKFLTTLSAAALLIGFGDSARAANGQLNFETFDVSDGLTQHIVYHTDGIGGTKVEGPNVVGRIFIGFTADFSSMTAIGNGAAPFATASGAGFIDAAQMNAGLITATGFDSGDPIFYSLAAWDTTTGDGTFAGAFTAKGNSMPVMINVGGTLANGDPGPVAPTLNTFASFNLEVVPEPSTVALGVIGGLALLMRRRK